MGEAIEIHLRDLGKPLIEAWNREFAGIDSVRTSCGDIFSTKPGQVNVDDPIDVKADAIVSPANSFGFMDGGIDAVYWTSGHQEHLVSRARNGSRSSAGRALRPADAGRVGSRAGRKGLATGICAGCRRRRIGASSLNQPAILIL